MISRRSLLSGLASLIAAPAVVRASSLMPVRGIVQPVEPDWLREAYNLTLRQINENLYGDFPFLETWEVRLYSEVPPFKLCSYDIAYSHRP